MVNYSLGCAEGGLQEGTINRVLFLIVMLFKLFAGLVFSWGYLRESSLDRMDVYVHPVW